MPAPGSTGTRQRLRPVLTRMANRVRREVARVDNPEVRKARRLARASRSGSLDVLYLGDSTVSWVAPYDADRRPVDKMVADLLGDRARLHAVHGGSYNPPLYRALLRMLDPTKRPRVIIVPLCVRMVTTPWTRHPVFGHDRAIRFLSSVDPSGPLWRIRKGFPPRTGAEFEDFYGLPYPTWEGNLTIGEYVKPLKSMPIDDPERIRLLYSYHHGNDIHGAPALDGVRALGEDLRRIGAPVVAYQTPVPVEAGVEHHGPVFREVAERNFELLEQAFVAGYGPIDVLRTGTAFGTDQFIDWHAADEHLNERGRLPLSQAIAEAVERHLRDA